MAATKEDAQLIVQLTRWGTELKLEEAFQRVMADDFDSAAVSAREPEITRLLNFGETVGTLVKWGLLDRGLVLDLWWAQGAWERVGPAARRERERLHEARLYENFEALAASS